MEKKQFFIIGCIRSGTTFLCDLFTDFVDEIYNETADRDVKIRFDLIGDKNFACKFCEDFNNVELIKHYFKESKIILIIRDLRDVVNSIYKLNINSIPYRDFPAVNDICETNGISRFESSLMILSNYYNCIVKSLDNNFDLIDDIIIYDDMINNPIIVKKLFDKYFEEKNLDYYTNLIKITPDQKSYLNWTEEQKQQFKTYNNGYLNKLLLRFNFEKDDNW
jgi:hypothetical protein